MIGAIGRTLISMAMRLPRLGLIVFCETISAQNHGLVSYLLWRGGGGMALNTWQNGRGKGMENNHSTILISTCCECGKHYGVKPAHGGDGGLSHGLCQDCFQVAIEKLHARQAAAEGEPS